VARNRRPDIPHSSIPPDELARRFVHRLEVLHSVLRLDLDRAQRDIVRACRFLCAGVEWVKNVILQNEQVSLSSAVANSQPVSWVIPTGQAYDHVGTSDGSGPSWVASIVNAIGTCSYWSSMAVIITWDDWCGWYDHVPPPQVINDGTSWGSGYVYGCCVPLIVVSQHTKAAYVSHARHDSRSILKFPSGGIEAISRPHIKS
jgi:phospholipase C